MQFTNKKAVIFDLDGTLSNTLGALTEAINLTFGHFEFPLCTEDQVKHAIGNGARILIKRLIPAEFSNDKEKIENVLKEYNCMYALTYMHTDETYDGIKDLIEKLHKNGIKIAVFSNKQDEYVKALCKMYFPDNTISVARGQTELPVKPNVEGLNIILNQLNVKNDECIFVGDSGVDIQTAANAKMDFIGVSWGFVGKKGLMELGAKVIVDSPKEIVKMIKINL